MMPTAHLPVQSHVNHQHNRSEAMESSRLGVKTVTRAQQLRKIKKPILEKKRRDRINKSLDDLKDLMMKVYNKDVSDHKLEKADILELTVQYLHMVNSGSILTGPAGAGDLLNQYRAGYEHCLQEVCHFLKPPTATTTQGPSPPPAATSNTLHLQHRLLQHCQDKLSSTTSAAAASTSAPVSPGLTPGLPELVTPAYHLYQQQQQHEQLVQRHLHTLQQRQMQQQSPAASCSSGSSSLLDGICLSPAPVCDFSSGESMWRPW